jgi:tetratricopeptide (TPR) repeat protein
MNETASQEPGTSGDSRTPRRRFRLIATIIVGAFAVALLGAILSSAVTYFYYTGRKTPAERAAVTLREAARLYEERNADVALERCTEVLSYISREKNLQLYQTAKQLRGRCYTWLAKRSDKQANLTKAVADFEEALDACPTDRFPAAHAAVGALLGTAYRDLGITSQPETYLPKAISALESALTVYTLADYPAEYASTENVLGTTYANLARVSQKEENLKKAVQAYEAALQVLTADAYPELHKTVQANLDAAKQALR